MTLIWIPHNDNRTFGLAPLAEEAAKRSTQQDSSPPKRALRAKSTTLNNAMRKQQANRALPESVGAFSKRINNALPGKHTRLLYDPLSSREAAILSQLRTGILRLNYYLAQIGAVLSAECACGQGKEIVSHFLFRCHRWTSHRTKLLQCTDTNRGNLSYHLGGRGKRDDDKWSLDLDAV